MNFKQQDIQQFLKNPNPNIKAVVIFGNNEGLISDYTNQFALSVVSDLNDAFRVVKLQSEQIEKDPGLLFGEYGAQSLIGGRRVILIKNATNNLTKTLKELFKNSVSDTLVIITSTDLNTKSSLVVFAKDSDDMALISCYEDREESFYSFLKNYFIKQEMTISDNASKLLCSRLSGDRKICLNELEKLVTYLGKRKNVEISDIQVAISDTSESSVKDLCYFTATGQTEKALDAFSEVLNSGEEAVSVVRALSYHFLKLLNYAALKEKGQGVEMIVSSIKPTVMFYRKSDLSLQIRVWKSKNILDVLDLLYQTEIKCKTTGFPAEKIASYTMMQISSAFKKLNR